MKTMEKYFGLLIVALAPLLIWLRWHGSAVLFDAVLILEVASFVSYLIVLTDERE